MALTAAGACSAEELEMCSLKVLEPRGSPTQCLLQLLAERDCTLRYLLGCLERMGHEQACRVLSSAGTDGQGEPGGWTRGEHQGAGAQKGEMGMGVKNSNSCCGSCSALGRQSGVGWMQQNEIGWDVV